MSQNYKENDSIAKRPSLEQLNKLQRELIEDLQNGFSRREELQKWKVDLFSRSWFNSDDVKRLLRKEHVKALLVGDAYSSKTRADKMKDITLSEYLDKYEDLPKEDIAETFYFFDDFEVYGREFSPKETPIQEKISENQRKYERAREKLVDLLSDLLVEEFEKAHRELLPVSAEYDEGTHLGSGSLSDH